MSGPLRRTPSSPPRTPPAPALLPGPQTRAALVILQIAAVAVVIAALPLPRFELDRYTIPKELVVELAALAAGMLCLSSARRLSILMVDIPLIGYLLLSAASALLATNGWLAFRALGLSLSGATLFWCGRTLGRTGLGRPLLSVLAAAIVLGAVTGLAQAYGLIDSSLTSLSRAPGGTFGNRNFMAHLVALGLPLLLYLALEARDRVRFSIAGAGVLLAAAALVLSRSRAAWLGAAAGGIFFAVEGFWIGRLWSDTRLRRRVLTLSNMAMVGLVLALWIPNRLNWRSDSPYLDSLTGVTNYKEGSGRGRLIQYGNTLKMAARNPLLGVGPGNWPVYYPRFMSPGDPSFDADDIIPTNPWPSSDWMAVASERGFPALLLIALVGITTALGAWTRVRHSGQREPELADLTIVTTLLALGVIGSFDAVLLLPVPTYFGWIIIGTLTSTAKADPRGHPHVGLTAVGVGCPDDCRTRVRGAECGRNSGDGAVRHRQDPHDGARVAPRSWQLQAAHVHGRPMAQGRPVRPGPAPRRVGQAALPQPSGALAHST